MSDLLPNWANVTVEDRGAFWLVMGVDPWGVPRSGADADLDTLAARLTAVALREQRARAAVEPVTLPAIEPFADERPPIVAEPVVVERIVYREAATDPLSEARAALAAAVTDVAARRIGASVALYGVLTHLAGIPDEERSADQTLQLLQHQGWSMRGSETETARVAKLREIAAIETLEAAHAYDVMAGWP